MAGCDAVTGFSHDFGAEEVIFTSILTWLPAFGRTHSRYSLVLRFKSLENLSKPNIPKAQSQTTHIQVSCRSAREST